MAGFPLALAQQASPPILFQNPFRHDITGLPDGTEAGGPEWIARAEAEIAREPNPTLKRMYQQRLDMWKASQPVQADPNVSNFERAFGSLRNTVRRGVQMPFNSLQDAAIDTTNFFRNLAQPSTAVPLSQQMAQQTGPAANPWDEVMRVFGRGGQPAGPAYSDSGSGFLPSALGPRIEQMAITAVPTVNVSGRARTAERNAQVGGVPNSYHLSDNARDFSPPPGMTQDQLYTRLRGVFPPEFDVIKGKKGHVHVEPGPSMGIPTGGGGSPFAGLGPDYAQSDAFAGQALGILDKALGMADQPFTATTNAGPMPVFGGDLPEVQQTDYTKAREGLEALKPTAPTKEQTDDIELRNWFAGIGQAMAGLEDGAGLGRVLLALGGGSLMGNAAGKAEVSKEWKEFEQKQREYQEAVVRMDMREAEVKAAESKEAWNRSYQVSVQNFAPALQQWAAEANPTFADGYIITQKTDKATGEKTFQGTPYSNRTKIGILGQQAQIYGSLSGQRASAANAVFGATLPLMMNQAVTNFRGGDSAGIAGLVGEISATLWDNGTVRQLIGDEKWNEFQMELNKQMANMRMATTDAGYAEAYRRAGMTALAQYLAARPEMILNNVDLISGSLGMSQFFAGEDRKVTTRTGKTGTTTTVTE